MKLYLFLILGLLLSSCATELRFPNYQEPELLSEEEAKAFGPLRLIRPLRKSRISRGFSPANKNHFGIDFVAPRGTAVYSAHAGKVIYVGRSFRGYGRLVVIEHPDGYASFYAHLQNFSVHSGQILDAGIKIGEVGDSGNARGVHLHFEFRIRGKATNPALYF